MVTTTSEGATSPPRPLLVFDRGCPFSHRVLALLDHLAVAHDSRDARLGQRPAGLERWSPSGRLPLLVHGALTIGESRVMLDPLAEAYGFAAGYPGDLTHRTSQRHAMAFIDGFFAPRLFRDEPPLDEVRLAEYLDALERTTGLAPPAPSLFAFHAAPIWLRFQWWHPDGEITRAIRARGALAAWLDGAARIPAVNRTAPRREDNTRDFHAVCAMMKLAPP